MLIKKKNNQKLIVARSLPLDNELSSTSNNGLKNKKIFQILGGALSTLTTNAKTIIGAINELKSDLTVEQTTINGLASGTCTITQFGKMGHIVFDNFSNASPTSIVGWGNYEIPNIMLNPKPNRMYKGTVARVGSSEYFLEVFVDTNGKVTLRNGTSNNVNADNVSGEVTYWIN